MAQHDNFPARVAIELRKLAVSATKIAAGSIDAAKEDEHMIEQHLEAIKSTSEHLGFPFSEDLLYLVRSLALQAAWHAADERFGIEGGAKKKQEFEDTCIAIAEQGEISPILLDNLKWMFWNAAWYQANTRKGYTADAKKDMQSLELYFKRVAATHYQGVNLGGWLLLERWQCATLFDSTSHEQAHDEFTLCTHLGAEAATERISAWRKSWITKDDFIAIKEAGLNSCRLPFGYWVLDGLGEAGVNKGPFVGDGQQHIDDAVKWGEELGISILLDLHSVPGFQSGHQACGKENGDWRPHQWDVQATVKLLRMLAIRYKDSPSVTGIGVINEPDKSIPIATLVAFYRSAYKAIREAGMTADKVDIFFPIYQRPMSQLAAHSFPDDNMQGIILDIHLYQCFGWPWSSLTLQQHLARASDGKGHFPGIEQVMRGGCNCVVSEWSIRLPDWDPKFGMRKEWDVMNEDERNESIGQFAMRQVAQYNQGMGWFFWSWKVDANDPCWSFKECLAKGWFRKEWFAPATAPSLIVDREDHDGMLWKLYHTAMQML